MDVSIICTQRAYFSFAIDIFFLNEFLRKILQNEFLRKILQFTASSKVLCQHLLVKILRSYHGSLYVALY